MTSLECFAAQCSAVKLSVVVSHPRVKLRKPIVGDSKQFSVIQRVKVSAEQDSVRSTVVSLPPISTEQVGRLERFWNVATADGTPAATGPENGLTERPLLRPDFHLCEARYPLFEVFLV